MVLDKLLELNKMLNISRTEIQMVYYALFLNPSAYCQIMNIFKQHGNMQEEKFHFLMLIRPL